MVNKLYNIVKLRYLMIVEPTQLNLLVLNLWWIIPFAIFDLVLKLFSTWKAAKNNQLYWFIALFVVNSAGILPIVYLYFFEKNEKKSKK